MLDRFVEKYLLNEAFVKKVVIKALEIIAAKTPTTIDDEIIKTIKEALEDVK